MPRVWPLISQVAFRSQASGVFLTSPAFWKVGGACLLPNPSRDERSFCHAFRRFSFGSSEPPEPSAPCWRAAATIYPLGNCDSPGLETNPGYLTRFGTASHRSSSLSPFFAFTDGARTPPEELVNPASAAQPCGLLERGWVNQPDPTFPQSPGIIPETPTLRLSIHRPHFSSFNELVTAYQTLKRLQR